MKAHHYPESKFAGFADTDCCVAFYSRINALVEPEMVVADMGCGRGAHQEDDVRYRRELRILRGKVSQVIGLDVDRVGINNPFLDEFRQLTPGSEWPLESRSIDLLYSDNVLEHVPNPAAFFREAGRVVKPGGYICIRTPNRWGYVAVVSRMIPSSLHGRVLKLAQNGRKEEDVFPTLYRCNTIPALRKALRENGFDGVVYGFEAEPSYFAFSKIAYRVGVWRQRWAPGFMKLVLFAFGRKV